MASDTSIFTAGPLRILLALNLTMQWISSVIVLGLVTYFIHAFGRGTHDTYDIIIAALNVWAYSFGQILPLIKSYKGYMVPMHVAFAILWLTSFILAVLDYHEQKCLEQCSKKKALQAFAWLSFFFTLTAIPLDALLYLKEHRKQPVATKTVAAESSTASTVEKNGNTSPVADKKTEIPVADKASSNEPVAENSKSSTSLEKKDEIAPVVEKDNDANLVAESSTTSAV